MPNQSSLYAFRLAEPSDINFIYSSWLKSFRHGSDFGRSMRSSVFFENYREVIDSILETASVTVAYPLSNPQLILGYLVHENNVIHYVFIKEIYRRIGLMGELIRKVLEKLPGQTKIIYTHSTFDANSIKIKFLDKITYNPLLLYKKSSS